MINRFAIASVIFVFALFAHASDEFIVQKNGDIVYNDSRGMPRLFVKATDPEIGLLLDWSESNRYERKIYGVLVDLKVQTGLTKLPKMQWQALETFVSKIFKTFRKKRSHYIGKARGSGV